MEGTSSVATIVTLMISLTLIMRGELRLEGRVFSVGSVEEKVEAAKDDGYRQIFLTVDNEEQ